MLTLESAYASGRRLNAGVIVNLPPQVKVLIIPWPIKDRDVNPD